MRRLTPENIIAQRRNNKADYNEAVLSCVDMSRPFIPEQYTQLYHSDVYSELTTRQRLRYNQLFAARTNEQFMLFESGFTNRVMHNMLCSNMLKYKHDLQQCLHILLEEEEKHSHMFMALNVKCFPQLYRNTQYHFLRLSWIERLLLAIVCRYPQYLVSLLWLVLLMEEHAVRFSKDVLNFAESGTLGRLEDNFIHTHKLHLKDEAGHVHIDANIIDFVLDRSSRGKKRLNVKLLKKLLQATLRPKHAGINVVKQFVADCPELEKQSGNLLRAIRSFEYDPCMLPMLEDHTQIPVTTALLELYPEFETALLI